MEERFLTQINNGNNPLIAFIKTKDTTKLIDITEKDFDVYEIDKVNDIYVCVVPYVKKK
jgi:hypothetical protein